MFARPVPKPQTAAMRPVSRARQPDPHANQSHAAPRRPALPVPEEKPPAPLSWSFATLPMLGPAPAASSPAPPGSPPQTPSNLKIAALDDPLERQAEQQADRFVSDRMTSPAKMGRAGSIQSTTPAPTIVHQVLNTPGHPIDSVSRAVLEPRFGHSFGAVRLHTDEMASRSAKALHSLAYTAGDHIVFAAGQYAAARDAHPRLLAHELVHTIQQGGRPLAIQRAPDPAAHPLKRKSHARDTIVQVTWTREREPFRLRLIHALRRTPEFHDVPTHLIEQAFIIYEADHAFLSKHFDTFKPGQQVGIRVATAYYDPDDINVLRDLTLTNWQPDAPLRQLEEERSINDRIVRRIVAADSAGWEGLDISIVFDGHKITGLGFGEVGPQRPRDPTIPRLSEKAAVYELSDFLDRATRRPGQKTGFFRRRGNGAMYAENEAIHHGLPESSYNRIVEVRTVEVTIDSLRQNAKSLEHMINDSNDMWRNTSSWITGNTRTSSIDYYDRMGNQDFQHIFLLLTKAAAAVKVGDLPLARAMIAYCEPELFSLTLRFKAQQKDLQHSSANSIQSAEKVKAVAQWAVTHLATEIGGPTGGQVADHLYGAVLNATDDLARHAYGVAPALPPDPLALMQVPLPTLQPVGDFSKNQGPHAGGAANDNAPIPGSTPPSSSPRPVPVANAQAPTATPSWSTNPPTASIPGGGQSQSGPSGLLADTDTMTSGYRTRQVQIDSHPIFGKRNAANQNDTPEPQADAAAIPIAVNGQRPRQAPTFVEDDAPKQNIQPAAVPAQMAKKPTNSTPATAPAPPARMPSTPAPSANRARGAGGRGRAPAPVGIYAVTPGIMSEAQIRAQMRVQRGTYVYIVSDETGTLQKAGISDNPFDRARSSDYRNSIYTHMRVVAGPMAKPQALTAETMLSNEFGEAGLNVRKNTITEMKGGADWEDSIEHVRVYSNARPLFTITIPR